MAKYDQVNSVIGEGSVFEGKFYISGSLKVDGKFEGDIKTEDMLIIGQTGRVKTNIIAKEVIMAGALIGNIGAKESVRLTSSGRMLGNIKTPILYLAEGVIYKGNVDITSGSKQTVEKIIADSFDTGKKDNNQK